MATNFGNFLNLGGGVVDYLQGRSAIGNMQKAITAGSQQAQAMYGPYASAGTQGTYNLKSLIGGGGKPAYDYRNPASLADAAASFRTPGQALEADPGYQFRQSEGNKAIERAAAARGTLLSGGTLKALASYNQDLASQEYGNAFNRNLQTAQLGYNATASQADLQQQMGAAIAAGDYGRANQLSSLIQQGVSIVGDYGRANQLSSLIQQGVSIAGGLGGAAGAAGGGGGIAGLGGIAGGIGKSIGSLAGAIGSIPVAGQIALGAAGAFLLGKKVFGIGNTHEKANTWVQGNQNKFDQYMGQIGEYEKSGQFSPEQAQAARQNVVQQYSDSMNEFAGTGKDQKRVIGQAQDTFRKNYGDPSQYGVTFANPNQKALDMFKNLTGRAV